MNCITCPGHTRPVTNISFSAFNPQTLQYYVLTACKDGIPILRNGRTGETLGSLLGHKGAVWDCKLSRDASVSVTGSADFTAKVWETHSSTLLRSYEHKHIVKTVDLSLNHQYLLTAGHEKKAFVFDLFSEHLEPMRVLEGSQQPIRSAILDFETHLVFHTDGKQLKIWDIRDPSLVGMRSFSDELTQVSFSWDRRHIICCSGNMVTVYDAIIAHTVQEFQCHVQVSCAALHPNRTRLALGGTQDLWLREHSVPSGDEIEIYQGHHGPIHGVAYSPDGEKIGTASEDGTLRLWTTRI